MRNGAARCTTCGGSGTGLFGGLKQQAHPAARDALFGKARRDPVEDSHMTVVSTFVGDAGLLAAVRQSDRLGDGQCIQLGTQQDGRARLLRIEHTQHTPAAQLFLHRGTQFTEPLGHTLCRLLLLSGQLRVKVQFMTQGESAVARDHQAWGWVAVGAACCSGSWRGGRMSRCFDR